MQTLAFVAIGTVLLNLTIGFRVYFANRIAPTNRLFFLMCITLCFWGLGYANMIVAADAVAAMTWRTVSAVGWCFFYSVFLLFSLRFTGDRSWLNHSALKWVLPLPAVVFFLYNAMLPPDNLTRTEWGWIYLYTNEVGWQIAFLTYYSIYTLTAFGLIYRWGNQAKTYREQKQSQIIVRTMLAVFIVAAPFDTYLPLMGYSVPPIAILMSSVFVAGIWYAITRYKLMQLNFDTAASHILHNMTAPIILAGPDGTVREVNKSFCELVGREESAMRNEQLQHMIRSADEKSVLSLIMNENVTDADSEILLRVDYSEQEVPCLMSRKTLRDEFGDVLGVIVALHDISNRKLYEELLKQANETLEEKVESRTAELERINLALQQEIVERKAAQKQLSFAANFDLLTGLPNRHQFCQNTDLAILQSKNREGSLAIIFFDLDNFKALNDTYGHSFGDQVLRAVGNRLRDIAAKNDSMARIGGDEFLLLVEAVSVEKLVSAVEQIVGGLRNSFTQAMQIQEREVFLTASLGVAIYPNDGSDAETMIRNADIAMYEAKRDGKNSCRFCSAAMKDRVAAQNQIRNQLFQAIAKRELQLHYQPKIDLKTGAIVGVEALLRWRIDDAVSISPAEFIPIAEETGLIVPIGEWVIRQALAQLKHWHDQGFEQLTMAVNLSARQLRDVEFAEQVAALLDRSGMLTNRMELEITESIAFARDITIISNINCLKSHRFKIAIDDFGTEYSSFINMKLVPFDCLKIPKEFISGIGNNAKDEAIVNSIVELTRQLGIKVVAEGVENSIEVEFLRRAGCDEIQGFYFYPPMEAEKVEQALHTGKR